MNRYTLFKCIGIVILICCSFEITIPNYCQDEANYVQYAGVNGKFLQKGAEVAKKSWKWLKGCSSKKQIMDVASTNGRLIQATEILVKGINEVRTQEEVLPKIGKYLSQTKPNEDGVKVINCVKTEANEIKMYLEEQGKFAPTKEKVIKIVNKSINLAEYDILAMQENYYKNYEGIEYVEFIIPKRAQYILNGQYGNRLYECMVFNLRKDIEGNWEKFKEYLFAFIDDIMNRPVKLWDEYMFRRGLARQNINERDVTEMERYLFAYSINIDKEYDTKKHIQQKIA